jgi:fructose-bisphosphate aldolase class II
MRYVFRKTLEKVLADNPNEYAVVKLMPTVYEAVQTVVEEKILAFGSKDKAVV